MISLFLIVPPKAQVKSCIEQLACQCGTASETVHNQRDAYGLRLFDLEQKVERAHTMQDDRPYISFGQDQMAAQHLGLHIETAPTQTIEPTFAYCDNGRMRQKTFQAFKEPVQLIAAGCLPRMDAGRIKTTAAGLECGRIAECLDGQVDYGCAGRSVGSVGVHVDNVPLPAFE